LGQRFEREADVEFDSRDELRQKVATLRVGTVARVGDQFFERIDGRRARYGTRLAIYTEQPSLI
jgi:hypothetical protein